MSSGYGPLLFYFFVSTHVVYPVIGKAHQPTHTYTVMSHVTFGYQAPGDPPRSSTQVRGFF